MNPDQHTFINRLRILNSIDCGEVMGLSVDRWKIFSADPYRFLMQCDDQTAESIWRSVERRER